MFKSCQVLGKQNSKNFFFIVVVYRDPGIKIFYNPGQYVIQTVFNIYGEHIYFRGHDFPYSRITKLNDILDQLSFIGINNAFPFAYLDHGPELLVGDGGFFNALRQYPQRPDDLFGPYSE